MRAIYSNSRSDLALKSFDHYESGNVCYMGKMQYLPEKLNEFKNDKYKYTFIYLKDIKNN